MTIYLSAARAMLAIPEDQSSWDCICEDTKSFLWTDDDTIEPWNEIAVAGGLPQVEQRVDGESAESERMFLTYKGNKVEVPLTHSRDDRLGILHTLGWLVRNDSEIRFCLDSYHSSDLAFLALPPQDWKALEREFGAKAVAFRFLAFPKDLEKFFEEAFSEENNRGYGPNAATEKAVIALLKEVTSVVKTLAPEVQTVHELDLDIAPTLGLELLTITDAQRDAIYKSREHVNCMIEMLTRRCTELGLELVVFTLQSHETNDRDFQGDWTLAMEAARDLLKRA